MLTKRSSSSAPNGSAWKLHEIAFSPKPCWHRISASAVLSYAGYRNTYTNHVPVRTFGINRKVLFLVKSYAARDALGKKLAPGELRRELGLDRE